MDKHKGSIQVRSRSNQAGANGSGTNGSGTNSSGTVFMLFFPDYGVGQPTVTAHDQATVPVVSEQLA
jgi:hypothetical protein